MTLTSKIVCLRHELQYLKFGMQIDPQLHLSLTLFVSLVSLWGVGWEKMLIQDSRSTQKMSIVQVESAFLCLVSWFQ